MQRAQNAYDADIVSQKRKVLFYLIIKKIYLFFIYTNFFLVFCKQVHQKPTEFITTAIISKLYFK